MNDKQQLAAMGDELRLTEEQAKGLAERMPQVGVLQVIDDQPLCMAKRIEELEAQVRVMTGALREARQHINGGQGIKHGLDFRAMFEQIDAALAGKLPERHSDDDAVDRFAVAMKEKLAAARAKGRGGWNDPGACSVEFLAELLVGHIGKGNPGNFEDIGNLAMMLHQRGADPAVLASKLPEPAAPEGWQLVPVEPTEAMVTSAGMFMNHRFSIWEEMLAAAPKPGVGDHPEQPLDMVFLSDIASLQRYTLGGHCDPFGQDCGSEMELDDEGEYILLADALTLADPKPDAKP